MRMPVFRRTKRWLLVLSSLFLSSIVLTACGENSPSILNTFGPVAADESVLFWVILIVSSIVFVAVEGTLVFSIFRFRERPGAPNPVQRHGNTTLEIAWTAIPTVVLFIVLFFTIRGLIQVSPQSQPVDPNTVNVTVVGHQWWWEFDYDQYSVDTADTLQVPANTVIHLNLFSNNVIHSFWVPALTGKTDVIPGHDNTKWFVANSSAVGKTFTGLCAEYCGTQHANMRFDVKVVTMNQFKTWISEQQQQAVTPAASSLASQGEAVFKSTCTGCHGIVGVDIKSYPNTEKYCNDSDAKDLNSADCLVGPNLTHFGSRDLIAGGVLTNNKDQCDPTDPDLFQHCNLAKWLQNPQAIKPGNDMIINLNQTQIRELVAYLEGLN